MRLGCPPCRMEHEVLSFYKVSCLLDVRAELNVTSLKQKDTFRHPARQVKPLRINSWLTTTVVPLRS